MNKQQIKLYSSKNTDHWGTPREFFNNLNKEFNFSFDPCPLNSLIDGLNIPWHGRVFCNPPYSKVKEFLEKGLSELNRGNCELIVYLIFANTDTKYFHEFIYKKAEIRFLEGRLKFTDLYGEELNSAMRPSMLAIFRKKNKKPTFQAWGGSDDDLPNPLHGRDPREDGC